MLLNFKPLLIQKCDDIIDQYGDVLKRSFMDRT